MTVTGKIRKVEMREAAVQILQGGRSEVRLGGGVGPQARPRPAGS
jgi:hypothetical protein